VRVAPFATRLSSQYPRNAEPFGVFDAILAKAVRLCQANFGILWLTEGDGLRHAELFEPVWNILHTAPASCDYRSAQDKGKNSIPQILRREIVTKGRLLIASPWVQPL
jgi:hypothetical protein